MMAVATKLPIFCWIEGWWCLHSTASCFFLFIDTTCRCRVWCRNRKVNLNLPQEWYCVWTSLPREATKEGITASILLMAGWADNNSFYWIFCLGSWLMI